MVPPNLPIPVSAGRGRQVPVEIPRGPWINQFQGSASAVQLGKLVRSWHAVRLREENREVRHDAATLGDAA